MAENQPGKFEKAFIQPLDRNGNDMGKRIPVKFNPSEYSLSRSNQYQKTSIPGRSSPNTQFLSGSGEFFNFELFFDTYENATDVRDLTKPIIALMDINKESRTPPQCKFVWGVVIFTGIIEEISQKFTMFLNSGTPVRATLNIKMSEYKSPADQEQEEPVNSAGNSREYVVVAGDTLSAIAYREYGDAGLWRVIAQENGIQNPKLLQIGTVLKIPAPR